MTRLAEPAVIVSGKIEAIRGALNGISASGTGPWSALDRIRQIITGSRTMSGLEPGGSASIVGTDVRTVRLALDEAASHLRDRVAGCPDCDADPSDLCGTCDTRLARISAYDALARLLSSEGAPLGLASGRTS